MDKNLKQQMAFEANRRSTGLAYLLWLVFGGFGLHRFYLGRKRTGFAQLALGLLGWIPFFAGWIVLGMWWMVDAFLIPDMARKANMDLLEELDGGERPAARLDYEPTPYERAPTFDPRVEEIRELSRRSRLR